MIGIALGGQCLLKKRQIDYSEGSEDRQFDAFWLYAQK